MAQPPVLGGGSWADIYDRAMQLFRGWEQTVRDGSTVDQAAARQQYQSMLGEISRALDDPTLSQQGARSLNQAAY